MSWRRRGCAPALRDKILKEFYDLAVAYSWAREGGLNTAFAAVPVVAGRRCRANSSADQPAGTQDAICLFAEGRVDQPADVYSGRAPQTIALIVSHLAFHKASEILSGLPGPKQIEVVKRVANMEQTNPEVIGEVEKGLEARLANMLNQSFEKIGGVETVAEMLNLVDRTTEKGIMEGLESEDPDLVEEIRRLMFVFEDILLVDDKGIQAVLKEIDNDELALSLKTASEELRDKIFKNMSERAATLIQEDMEFMGPVRVADVEAAQQRIVDIVRRLEDAGEIIIAGRGGDKDLIV